MKCQIKFIFLFWLLLSGNSGAICNDDIHELEHGKAYENVIVNCFCRTPEGFLWIGTTNGLLLFDGYETQLFQHAANHPRSLSNNHINCLHYTNNNELLIGTRSGLNKYNAENNSFEKINLQPSFNDKTRIDDMVEDTLGNIWLAVPDAGLIKYSCQTNEQKKYIPLPKYGIAQYPSCLLTEDMLIYLGTQSSIQVFDIRKGTFSMIRTANTENALFKDLCFDEQGNIFAATWNNGLFHAEKEIAKAFAVLDFDITGQLYTIQQTRQHQVRMGSFKNGLLVYDVMDNNVHQSLEEYLHIREFYNDFFGINWIGTNKSFLYESAYPYQFPPHCFVPNEFISRDSDDNSFLGMVPDTFQSMFPGDISCLEKENDSVTWIGTWTKGLIKYYSRSGEYQHYIGGINSNLSMGFVNCIHADEKIWIGTNGGLNEYIATRDSFVQHHIFPQLKTEIIYKILPGKDNDHLWLSTSVGICRFNKKNNEFMVLDEHYGIPPLEFIPGYGSFQNNGEMVFGAKTGLFQFSPDSIRYDTVPPVLSIKKIMADERKIQVQEKIQLDASENNIKIWMQTSGLIVTENIRYKYRIPEISNKWTDNGKDRLAVIRDLPPGKYTFQFIASNQDLTWAKQPYSLEIVIQEQKNNWLLAFIVLVLTSTGIIVIIFLQKKQKRKPKYATSNLPENELKAYYAKLEQYMQKEKPYKQKVVHLNDVAKTLDIHPNYLSQAVNQLSGNKFFDYLNQYRIDEAKKMLKDPAYDKHNLMGIGFEAGFNSKSSFYAVFKKNTGMTPAQYRKKYLKK